MVHRSEDRYRGSMAYGCCTRHGPRLSRGSHPDNHPALAFDGGLEISRTAGQIGSCCDSEAANTLTLNVLVDLLEGRRTVEEARAFLAENLTAYALGRDAPYAEQLQFTPGTGTADPDEGIIGQAVLGQAVLGQAVLDQLVEKAKDTIGQGDPPQA
jgi:hypothetical protein